MEVDPLVLDFRPLLDHRQDEEAEDQDGDAELDREPDPFAARRAGPEPRAGFADPMEYWLPLHLSYLSCFARGAKNQASTPTRSALMASHHRERGGCTAAGPPPE